MTQTQGDRARATSLADLEASKPLMDLTQGGTV